MILKAERLGAVRATMRLAEKFRRKLFTLLQIEELEK